MAESSGDLSLGYMMGQSESGKCSNGGDMFGGSGIWGLLALALVFGSGYGGGGIFGGGGYGGQALTRAELYDGFAIQNIDSAVRGVQQGIADATYALNNSITSGFHGVDSAICNLGYNVQSGFNGISSQLAQCCCDNRAAIADVKYQMATDTCALGNTIQNGLRDVIDANNANYRSLFDFMVNEKLASKDARIAELQNQLSQSNQNAVLRAAIDASTAEIIRRTGHDCPSPAYWVSPPTPVQVPYQGCGCGCG